AHLEDYQELNKVGSVTFGGSKGSISGKGTIRLGNLVFDDVQNQLGHGKENASCHLPIGCNLVVSNDVVVNLLKI
ncbi:hypothetical protein Tco_0284597, partial [Tanacetum coccineum]